MLRNLKRIFISHIHADHHFGVSVILAKHRSVCILSAIHCGLQLIFASAYPITHRVTLSCHDSWSKQVPPRIVGYSGFRTERPFWKWCRPDPECTLHYRCTEYATGGMWQVGGNEPWVERKMSVVKRCLLPLLLNSLVRSRKRSSDMCHALGLSR